MHEGSWKHRGSAFTPDDSFGFFCYKKSCLHQACLDNFQEIELKVIWTKGMKARKEDPLGEISRDVIRRGCHRLGVVVSGMSTVAEPVSSRTWRERQILRHHPKSTESGTLETGSGIGTQPSRWFWCMLKFKTHHHRLRNIVYHKLFFQLGIRKRQFLCSVVLVNVCSFRMSLKYYTVLSRGDLLYKELMEQIK